MSAEFTADTKPIRGRLENIRERLEPDVLRPLAEFSAIQIGAKATSRFMREGKDEDGPNTTGVLRKRTRRLARAVAVKRGRVYDGGESEGFVRITAKKSASGGVEIEQEQGTTNPYALANEKGADETVTVKGHTRRSKADDVIKDVSKRGRVSYLSQGITFVKGARPAHEDQSASVLRSRSRSRTPAHCEPRPKTARRGRSGQRRCNPKQWRCSVTKFQKSAALTALVEELLPAYAVSSGPHPALDASDAGAQHEIMGDPARYCEVLERGSLPASEGYRHADDSAGDRTHRFEIHVWTERVPLDLITITAESVDADYAQASAASSTLEEALAQSGTIASVDGTDFAAVDLGVITDPELSELRPGVAAHYFIASLTLT